MPEDLLAGCGGRAVGADRVQPAAQAPTFATHVSWRGLSAEACVRFGRHSAPRSRAPAPVPDGSVDRGACARLALDGVSLLLKTEDGVSGIGYSIDV